jgi:hypothetical protein
VAIAAGALSLAATPASAAVKRDCPRLKSQPQRVGPSIPGATDIHTVDVKCGRASDFIRTYHRALLNGRDAEPRGWNCTERALNRDHTKTGYRCSGPGAQLIRWVRHGQLG